MKFKNVVYWCSIVAPIYDIACGLFKAIKEIPSDVQKIHANRLYLEQCARFYNETPVEDLEEAEFTENYLKTQKKKGKKKNG